MRLSLTAASLGVACFLGIAPSLTAEDAPAPLPSPGTGAAGTKQLQDLSGFEGKKFGTALADFNKQLEIDQDRGPLKLYVEVDSESAIGPVQLETILYYFFNDKFMGVGLHSSDGEDSAMLLRILETAFGPGNQPDPGQPFFYWKGKTSNVRYHLNPATGESSAFLSDNAMSKELEQYEAKTIAEAAAKL